MRIESAALRTLYNALLCVVLPFLPLRLWWRGRREPGYRRHIGERFGLYWGAAGGAGSEDPGAELLAERPLIWIHAVSLGETRASEPLVRALQRRLPGFRLLITHMTATGRQAGEALFPGAVTAFLPYDYPFAVRRFLAHFRPRLGILMETEIWPNLIRGCARAGIPLVLANARLSDRSAKGYARIAGLAEEAFGALSAVAAQSSADASRLTGAGARKVTVTGNLKFDIGNPVEAAPLAAQFRASFGERPVLLLASTREGEETLILDALGRRPLADGTLVVIVPRHPQRFDEVARMLAGRGLSAERRSENRAVPASTPYFLGDSIGEMAAYFLACDVAFVGGTLVPVGGQNLIEACAAGAPVIVGPSTFNFADAAGLAIEVGAALRVEGAKQLAETAAALLADEGRRKAMSDAGRAFAEAHRGAAERVAGLIAGLIGDADRPAS